MRIAGGGGGYGMMEVRRGNDSRTSVLLSERKDTMKRFTRFAALLLIGALALALLAGCGTSDTTKKKAVLTALQSVAKEENYTVVEDKELATAKTQEIFERFKQEDGEAYDEAAIQEAYQLHLDDLAGLTGYENSLNCTSIGYDEYGAMLIEMPRKAEKSTTWNKAAIVIYNSMWAYKAYSKQTLTVAISIIKDVKLTEEQEEPKDYMLVFAEHPIGEDGGGIGGGDDGVIVM